MAALQHVLPWQLKVAAKLVLARAPVPYDAWRRLSMFRHGRMDDTTFAVASTQTHVAAADPPPSFTMLEIGPGDSVASAVVAAALGAERSYLVDVGNYATTDVEFYRRLLDAIRAAGLEPPFGANVASLDEVLAASRATYLTNGLDSLRAIPDASIDVCWSNAVLEHVRLAEVRPTLDELRRVVRGRMSHQIDLRDHLADSTNNLRFPRSVWESAFVSSAGFYTNRLRASDWRMLFQEAGFRIVTESRKQWDAPKVPRRALSREFRDAGRDDLTTWDLHLVLE